MINILKSNSKYLVINNNKLVLKYDLRNNSKLYEEYERIKYLINIDSFYKKHHVPVNNFKKTNIYNFKGINSYEMPYIEGSSFSALIREENLNIKYKRNYINFLYKKFMDHSLTYDESNKVQKTILWKNKLKEVLEKIEDIHYLDGLLSNPIEINKIKVMQPKTLLKNFFDCKNTSYNSYEKIHGNFHSENIIIPKGKDLNDFKLIDPDCNLFEMDSIFSLARFLYTYVHDTVEHNQYAISSKIKINNVSFSIQYLWDRSIKKSYAVLDNIIAQNSKNFHNSDISNRLLKSFLLCLLIGINANNNGIEIKKLNSNTIISKSNSLFLLLKSLYYAHFIMNKKN